MFLEIDKKFHKHYFIILIVLFLATRLLMALFLAPHNDEIIYTQYAQIINQSWSSNKYISVDGNFLGDYKEPLQYWLTSVSVNWWANPLWGVRLWSIIVSLTGFVALLCFVKKLLGDRVTKIFALLYIFSGYYLYFDVVALAEVYIYSLGAIFLYLSYLWLVKQRWYYLAIASAIFSLALLSKTSAWLILVLGAILPCLWLIKEQETIIRQKWRLVVFYVFLLANVFMAKLVYWLFIPREFESVKIASPAFKAVLSAKELLSFPLGIWLVNLNFYFTQVLSSDWLFGLWLIFLFLGIYVCGSGQVEVFNKTKKLFFGLGLWWLVSLVPIIIFVRTNYFRHYGMWLSLFYIWVSFAISIGVDLVEKNTKTKLFAKVVVVLGSVLILNQAYSSFYPAVIFKQTDVGEQEVTDLWASPLGITELIDYLKTLPPATVLYDAQWGHFSVDMLVFNHYYPQLKFIYLESDAGRSFMMSSSKFKEKKYFIIFDTYWLDNGASGPPLKQIALNPSFCGQKKEIKKIYRKTEYSSKIIICEVN